MIVTLVALHLVLNLHLHEMTPQLTETIASWLVHKFLISCLLLWHCISIAQYVIEETDLINQPT